MPDSPITFRRATAADVPVIAAIHTRNWQLGYRDAFPDAFLDRELAGMHVHEWREKLTAPPPNQFVDCAMDGEEIIGFICAYGAFDAQWGSFIDNLHLDPRAQGRGVGAALMTQAAAWLERTQPDLPMFLYVVESNTGAKRFYERLGARDMGVIEEVLHGQTVRSNRYVWDSPRMIVHR